MCSNITLRGPCCLFKNLEHQKILASVKSILVMSASEFLTPDIDIPSVSAVSEEGRFNPLIPGGNKRLVIRAQTNLQLFAAGLSKYI